MVHKPKFVLETCSKQQNQTGGLLIFFLNIKRLFNVSLTVTSLEKGEGGSVFFL